MSKPMQKFYLFLGTYFWPIAILLIILPFAYRYFYPSQPKPPSEHSIIVSGLTRNEISFLIGSANVYDIYCQLDTDISEILKYTNEKGMRFEAIFSTYREAWEAGQTEVLRERNAGLPNHLICAQGEARFGSEGYELPGILRPGAVGIPPPDQRPVEAR